MTAGDVTYVSGDRSRAAMERLEADAQAAQRHQEHLWIVAVAHRISPEAARRVSVGESSAMLDAETAVVTGVGCYVCEEPWSQRLASRRCKGEPS